LPDFCSVTATSALCYNRHMGDDWRNEIERARSMTPDERVREGLRLFEQGPEYIVRSIETTFPEMPAKDAQRIRDQIIRRCKFWGIV
jgi:hypothetical protein